MGMDLLLHWMLFNLIFCSWCQRTKQITEQSSIITSLQPTKVLLDTLQLLINLTNNQVYLFKLFNKQLFRMRMSLCMFIRLQMHVTMNITIVVSSVSHFMGTNILCTFSLIFKSCFKLIISNYCMPCHNNAVYTISNYRLHIIIAVSLLQFYCQNPQKH